jgi:hypothetical protein
MKGFPTLLTEPQHFIGMFLHQGAVNRPFKSTTEQLLHTTTLMRYDGSITAS